MLLFISRSATRRLVSTAFATSPTRSVVFRVSAGSRLGAQSIHGGYPRGIRGLASATRPKKPSAPKAVASTKTKKPATKPTTKAKATAKPKAKATPKSKPKAKPKPKPKPPKGRVRKPLSEKAKGILERRTLKQAALFTEPKLLPTQPWQLFVFEKLHGKHTGQSVVQQMPNLSREFKALPSAELQRLESVTKQNKLTNDATYKAWVQSYSPQEVYNANLARKNLKRKYNVPKGTMKIIRDERLPKRPSTAYGRYTKARWASGEFAGSSESMHTVAATIGREWKSLSPAERRPYEDLAQVQFDAYEKATSAVISRKRSKQAKA